MNSLPQELVDYILDYLFDDKKSLLSSSTVCKSWLPTCSFHLFATFTVRLRYPMKDEPQPSSLTEFDSAIDLILQNSRINSHVEHLVIACYDYATPAHPFDEVILGRLIGPLRKLKHLTLHGVNLYCTRPLYASQPQRTLCSLCIEESRLSSDALRAMFARFTQVDQVQFIRILSIDSPYATPTPTPGPAAVSLPITLQTTGVRALTYSSCPRAQLSALVAPLLASINVDGELSLEFTNLLLDDLHAVDEHLAAFGPRVTHFSVELPDRWYSWDPPEGNIGEDQWSNPA
ncbi:hypothetical protein EIP86_005543 [Pleurotus ostreatoroseus]|nr:hypothetical protein EIP86_005543 [Pleurotus ostreatoroseus]